MSHFTGPLLPDYAVPSAYDLRLDLDFVAGSFTGTVAVNVELLKNSRFIVLNGLGLTVDRDASSFTPRESSEVRSLLWFDVCGRESLGFFLGKL